MGSLHAEILSYIATARSVQFNGTSNDIKDTENDSLKMLV